jgi:uncharacterized membrane protein
MDIRRIATHLVSSRRALARHFPRAALDAIAAAIAASETRHRGQIQFAVEAALSPVQVLRGMPPRERAIELFSTLRVWDTEHNSGVLIYVLLADHAIEIVADRGVDCHFSGDTWRQVTAAMQEAFSAGRFEAGALAGIEAVTAELVSRLPAATAGANELPNDVTLL